MLHVYKQTLVNLYVEVVLFLVTCEKKTSLASCAKLIPLILTWTQKVPSVLKEGISDDVTHTAFIQHTEAAGCTRH